MTSPWAVLTYLGVQRLKKKSGSMYHLTSKGQRLGWRISGHKRLSHKKLEFPVFLLLMCTNYSFFWWYV